MPPDEASGLRGLRLLVLIGPTAVGKSRIALRVAERLRGEIVGCDAVQVYRGLDAATAKPDRRDRQRVPHHLVDVADPRRDFSLGQYVRLAEAALADIAERGGVPIVVGGTGLYLRGLLRGVVPAPVRDEALRERLRRMASRHGSARLHRWLAALDPASARRLAPADAQRVVRALEIRLRGGTTWTERLSREGTWSEGGERFPSLKIGIDRPRDELVRRIDRRVDAFFAAGLVDEVRRLLDRGVPPTANAFKAIGYREVLRALLEGSDPEATREEIRLRTRQYAKRQRTWFRGEPGVLWLAPDAARDETVERIVALWKEGSRGPHASRGDG